MDGARASVLVVDDDEDLRDWLSMELTRAGFFVKTAASGREAVAVAGSQRFDVALIDLRMPGMDGIATLTALRERDPDLEAVMASGQGTIPDAVAALKLGAFDFVQKPYTLREMVPLLERALAKSHLQGIIALHAASNALLTLRGEQEIVSRTAELVQRLFRVTSFALVLHRRPSLEVVAPPSPLPEPPRELVLALAERASTAGAVRLRSGGEQNLGTFTSAIAASLVVNGGEVGCLVMLRDRALPVFTEEERQRVVVFGGQLALALDNARLHTELLARIEEVTRTRDALIFSEKLAMAGQLAAGVAHEIKNPLAFVVWNLDYIQDTTSQLAADLKDNKPPSSTELVETVLELRKASSEAREGVLRIRGIAADLSQLARPQDDVRAKLDLRTVADWAINVATPQIRPRARLVREYQDACDVIASEARLGQVFVNLLVNAAQAIPAEHASQNQITVRVRPEQGRVIAEVEDTGSGMEPAQLQHLFEPFFTTKQPGSGTGLGLTISRQIIEAHGGQITVDSAPGKGTRFRVSLPMPA